MRYRRTDLFWAPVLVLSAALSLAAVLIFEDGGWLLIPVAMLAYPAGCRIASLSLALWVFTAVTLVGLAWAFWHPPDPLTNRLSAVLVEFAASVLPWWVGRYRRLRAEQREHEHDIVAERAQLHERARIAQDMHDVLGHELALIALHGGALELATGLTDEQRHTARQLRAGATRATYRLHDIVRVLGSTDAAAGRRPADETIDDLVQRAASAGMPVRLRRDGPVPLWSPMVSQAARRVVQESLTNAARHAPGAPVTVLLSRRDTDTRVEIANDAPTHPGGDTGNGQGLIGLDERVRLVGGWLAAGARSDGGWTVTALLPDDAGPRHDADSRPDFELRVSKRLTRRRLLQTATFPLGIGLAIIVVIVVIEILSLTRTGLATDRYDQLRPGQRRVDVERLLPPHAVDRPRSVRAEPPQPAGAACVYYHAGDGPLTVSEDLYQLCFVDGVLVSKDRLGR
ncbi:sensor histidine kinase [Actinocrispum wychmicini]|uniref:sensor histidine kinase n=1 Tax=Actinocrispum wychmicini TaxID=1213861 RepID=UPI001053BBB9|nr:histidine kinase [Actinocrispum wychmicini]